MSDGSTVDLTQGRLLDLTIKKIRSRGGRITRARLAVLQSIVDAKEHVTADDIFAKVSNTNPDVHLSTVYRTLDALEEIGIVEHVHLGHGRATYHLEDNVHQHLVCENCGIAVEAPSDLTKRLETELEARLGFHTRAHHFSIIGLCSACFSLREKQKN